MKSKEKKKLRWFWNFSQSTGNLSLFVEAFQQTNKKKKERKKQTQTVAKFTERRTYHIYISIITKQPQSTLYVCYACELHEPRTTKTGINYVLQRWYIRATYGDKPKKKKTVSRHCFNNHQNQQRHAVASCCLLFPEKGDEAHSDCLVTYILVCVRCSTGPPTIPVGWFSAPLFFLCLCLSLFFFLFFFVIIYLSYFLFFNLLQCVRVCCSLAVI